MKPISKADLDDIVKSASFMQKFKMLLWEKMKPSTTFIEEDDLDKIAMELWEYVKKFK